MNFWSGIHKGKEVIDKGTEVINIFLTNEEHALEDRKEEYKIDKVIAVIGTVIVLGVCIGIMYIRFRVLGG